MRKNLILITGCDRGIGNALARHLAERGHLVVAGVILPEASEALGKIANIRPVRLDLTLPEEISRIPSFLESLRAEDRRLILINNAGLFSSGPWEFASETALRRQFEVNFFGPLQLTRQCLPLLRQSRGRIINISSVSGLFASPFLGSYAATKFALEAFSTSLRRELLGQEVSVTTINPGPVKTPLLEMSGLHSFESNPDFSVYQSALKKFRIRFQRTLQRALPVEAVIEAVEREIHSSAPAARVVVTSGLQKLKLHLGFLLPVKWVDRTYRPD